MTATETCQWCEQALPDCLCAGAREQLAFEHAVFDSWRVGDLAEEYCLAEEGRSFVTARALVDLGVPLWWVVRAGFGRMRVIERGSRWEPAASDDDSAGTWRLILPVWDRYGMLVDLLAMSSTDESKWTLRTGDGFVLGAERVAEADMASGAAWFRRANALELDDELRAAVTVRLFGTPLAWLRGLPVEKPDDDALNLCDPLWLMLMGTGICVLDWRPAALCALRQLGPEVTLLADDGAAAQRLHELLQWGGLPEIKAAPRERRLAA